MSKRSNENSSGTAPAVKRMVNGKEIGDGNNFVHPVEKVFPYHQSGSDLSPFYLSENLADVNFEFDSDDGAPHLTHTGAQNASGCSQRKV